MEHFQADDKPGSVFAQLQPEGDGRDEVVRELEHGETQAGQVVENYLLQSRTCCRLSTIASLTTQQTVQHRVFFIIDYFLPNKSIYIFPNLTFLVSTCYVTHCFLILHSLLV